MKIICSALLMAVSVGNLFAAGKPWPKQPGAVVHGSVTTVGGTFIYTYKVASSSKNEYPFIGFELDIRLEPQSHPLSRRDLTLTHTASEHLKILEEAMKIEVSSISFPDGWESVYPGLWGVIDADQRYMVKPGEYASGFSFVAQAPPSIRDCVLNAYSWDFVNNCEDYEFPGRKLSRVGDPDELTTEVNKGIQYLGKTIAPVKPPEPFTASSWIVRMTADVVEARKLKWIKTDRNLRELKQLISNLNTPDMVKLQAAVARTEVYVLSEKTKGNLSEEADALVRLNAQYLLHRLENLEAIGK